MIKRLLSSILGFTAVISLHTSSFSQIVINEIMSSNSNTIADNDGDYSDWIELYNAGTSSINLNGWGISDDVTKLGKWKLPAISIPAGGYQIIWASDKDTSILSSSIHHETILSNTAWKYINPTSSISSWKTTGFNDASWSTADCPIGYGDPSVTLNTSLTLSNPATLYLRKSFTVADKTKIKELFFYMAYDDGFVAYLNGIEIARGDISGSLAYNGYTGTAINEPNPKEYTLSETLINSALVNGTNVLSIEIHNTSNTSSDMLGNPFLFATIENPTTIYSSTLPTIFNKTILSNNVLHTNFSISSSGETIVLTNDLNAVQNVMAPQALSPDHSWGRSTNGGSNNVIFTKSTPKTSNTGGTFITGYTTGIINANLAAGFYSGSQNITLSFSSGTGTGETIRYTTDGSKPTSSSTSYTGAISVSSNKVIRAASFATEKIPQQSNYFTNTYIIGSKPTMAVVFLSGAPSDIEPSPNSSATSFYAEGPNVGTCGSTTPPYACYNYYQEWEKEVHVEFLTTETTNGSQKFEIDAGASIYGGWSRISTMKSMAIETRAQYGSKDGFDYQLFPNKPATHYTEFGLRNGGNDFQGTFLRDPFNNVLIQEEISKAHWNLDYEDYKPVIVFMNGKYFGVHQLRERTDDTYFENNHGVSKYDMVESRGEDNGELVVRNGTIDPWNVSKNFVVNNDMTIQSNYDKVVSEHFDIKNLADYFALETYAGNWDWPHNNVRVWKPRTGGQWRYIVHDMDFSYDLQSIWGITTTESNELKRIVNKEVRDWSGGNAYKPSQHIDIFTKLLTNNDFKTYFINRYADLLNTALGTTNTTEVWDKMVAELDPEVSAFSSQWGSNSGLTNTPQTTSEFAQGNGKSGWSGYCSTLRSKLTTRTTKVRDNIQSTFSNITAQQNTTLQSSPSNGGLVKVNTITPTTLPWTGVYFTGNAITLTAIANPGFVFTSWTITGGSITSGSTSSATISVNVTSTATIKANYSSTSNSPNIVINEINYNSASGFSSGDWIELYNSGNSTQDLSGWTVRDNSNYKGYTFPSGVTLDAKEYIVIATDLVQFKGEHPNITNVVGDMTLGLSSSGDRIRLFDAGNRVVTDFSYGIISPWPTKANGLGATLDLTSASNNPSSGSSWRAGCENGTPGTPYATYTPSLEIYTDKTSFCVGDSAKLKILNRNIGTTTNLQWRLNSSSISGAINKSYAVKTANASDKFTLVASLTDACATTNVVISNNLSLSVNPSVIPTISSSSSKSIICQNDEITLSANITNGGTSPIYQWLKNGVSINGATSSTYKTTSVVNNDNFSVSLISNATCVTTPTVSSSNTKITVNPAVIPTVSLATQDGEFVNKWNQPKFTATATNPGTSPLYTWYFNGQVIPGAISATYISNSVINGDKYYVKLTSNAACANPKEVNSNTLTFSILTNNNEEKVKSNINIYPNPAINFVTIEDKDFTEASLYNQLGVKVMTINSKTFDMSSLPTGMYFIDVVKDSKQYVSKIEKR